MLTVAFRQVTGVRQEFRGLTASRPGAPEPRSGIQNFRRGFR